MNTLAVLLLTTCATGADPAPLAEPSPAAFPSQDYTDPGWSGRPQESRPGLFARIRGLFGRHPQGYDQPAPDSFPAYQGGVTGSGELGGTVFTPSPVVAPYAASGPASTPMLHPQPAASPLGAGLAQPMPGGEPPLK